MIVRIILTILFSCLLNLLLGDCEVLDSIRSEQFEKIEASGDYEDIILFIHETADLLFDCQDYKTALEWLSYKHYYAESFEQQDDAFLFLEEFDSFLNEYELKLSNLENVQLRLANKVRWSGYYEKLDHTSKSLLLYEEAVSLLHDSIYTEEDVKKQAIGALLDLGMKYDRSGYYFKAKALFEEAMRVAKKRNEEHVHINVGSLVLGRIASNHWKMGQLDEAKRYADLRLEFATKLMRYANGTHIHLKNAHYQLARLHIELGNFDTVRMHIHDLALLGRKYNFSSYDREIIESQLFLAEGKIDLARNVLIQIIDEYGDFESFYNVKEKFKSLEMVDHLIECGAYKEASELNEVIKFKLDSIRNALDYLAIDEKRNMSGFYLSAIENQLTIPHYASKEEQINIAYEGYEIIEDLIKRVGTIDDKLILSGKAASITNALLNLLYEDKDEHIDDMFYAMESAKSGILLRTWKDQQLDNLQASETLFNLENQLIAEISKQSKNRLRAKSFQEQDSIGAIVSQKQINLDSIKSMLAHRNALYYKMKYDWSVPSFKDFAQSLSRNQTFVNFYESDSFLYVMSINRHRTNINRLKKEDYEEKLKLFYKQIASIEFVVDDLSEELYNIFLSPFQEEFKEHVVFSCAGQLQHLPISGLKQTKDEYLIANHAVSYTPSASFMYLQGLNQSNSKITNALFIAPEFSSDTPKENLYAMRKGFGPLFYNEYEVEKVSSFIDGSVFTGTNASKAVFLEHVREQDIIHLATHAKSNPHLPDDSFLAFGNSEQELLYLNELSKLEMAPRMMVLSACETGLGKDYKGEGAISLANACFFAGSESVVATQWSVLDEPTSAIITSFYKHLKKGNSKDKALQAAQLEYLEKNAGEALHPYTWAGISVFGNTEALYSNPSPLILSITAVLLFSILLFFYLRFFRTVR